MKKSVVITLDGPSGSGKSTVGAMLARELGYRYLDTGAMYRAVALAALRAGVAVDPPDAAGIDRLFGEIDFALDEEGRVLLDGERVDKAIREDRVTEVVSAVAALEPVRNRMVALQRAFAAKGDVVAEGRDMGTVVFPDGENRFFLDAEPRERARRRARQRVLEGWGEGSEEEALDEMKKRDKKDSERELAPLSAGPGLFVVDTTGMTPEEVVSFLIEKIKTRNSGDFGV